jgi:phospho-N-acetylmuramoyl-pentapeptide-transferase
MRLILIAGALALIFSLFGTPALIKVLARRGYGQFIRDDGPSTHHTKRGTPTMGGIIIIFATIFAYFLAHLLTQTAVTVSALLIIGLVLGLGLVGFLDDYLKVSRQNSRGISGKQKIFGQVFFASTFGYLGLQFPDADGLSPISQNLSTVRDTGINLGVVLVIIWIAFMVTATSNGVNLILIGVWEFGQSCAVSVSPNCYNVRDPLDLAVLAAAFAGSCTGFLWWNASPAKIFMGDTGSLALGGALAGLAASLRVELLLIPLGGLFVIITLSVALQVIYFRLTGGKRLFKMAPLQHHFELLGWGEVTIVLRFWIIAGLCVALGLGLFYTDWVAS